MNPAVVVLIQMSVMSVVPFQRRVSQTKQKNTHFNVNAKCVFPKEGCQFTSMNHMRWDLDSWTSLLGVIRIAENINIEILYTCLIAHEWRKLSTILPAHPSHSLARHQKKKHRLSLSRAYWMTGVVKVPRTPAKYQIEGHSTRWRITLTNISRLFSFITSFISHIGKCISENEGAGWKERKGEGSPAC